MVYSEPKRNLHGSSDAPRSHGVMSTLSTSPKVLLGHGENSTSSAMACKALMRAMLLKMVWRMLIVVGATDPHLLPV